ncbi:CoA-transferase family III [Zopfia rhizophila CBS 207.26]|uniref:CoA-transferase family III n=1 Tax=Zopfia rhizophila CBS 207.26 TaxID=1314779 RepID=A0A6A6DB62_9PEZI|nr:CoA-transferase family III [Zopfia rhizophila CBS 207.26]
MTSNELNGHTNGVTGVNESSMHYSVVQETVKLFHNGLVKNPLIASSLPKEIEECAKPVQFEGTDKPSIPINWRFAESMASLKGLEAAMINVLLKRKYGVEPQKAHPRQKEKAIHNKYFKNTDLHNTHSSPYRINATNIYKCKDGRYFHLHASMNPQPSQQSLGLPDDMDLNVEESLKLYQDKISQIESGEMQKIASDVYKQAGTICWTTEEYRNSEHGKANAHVGLYEVHDVKNAKQPPCWWPDIPETSPQRPLAGLKVVDLTRVIAAPAVTRGLAELGASVMRITAEHITDMSQLHCDLNWGKWNAHLDFRKEEDREKLRALAREADVVVQGYRPGVLDKYGFSVDGLLELTKDRERGLIVVRENCYGWQGPWSYRSGWQQISDANCGMSMEFGRAMGSDEPVTPVFPNSDYCTGVCGVIAILNALLRRGTEGGSYKVDVALNYYSQWLVNSVGVYPKAVWEDVWNRNGRQVFRHYHNMQYTLPRFFKMLRDNSGSIVFDPKFFENRYSGAIGKNIRTVKPIIQFPDGLVQLKYNVGTRSNGIDQPKWPENLMTEVVV